MKPHPVVDAGIPKASMAMECSSQFLVADVILLDQSGKSGNCNHGRCKVEASEDNFLTDRGCKKLRK